MSVITRHTRHLTTEIYQPTDDEINIGIAQLLGDRDTYDYVGNETAAARAFNVALRKGLIDYPIAFGHESFEYVISFEYRGTCFSGKDRYPARAIAAALWSRSTLTEEPYPTVIRIPD